jgi:predicted ATPase with chaperone activity
MFIPYAIEVGGQVIRVFDNVNHVLVEQEGKPNYDPRWAFIQRPVIITGGELTLETLDLVYDENSKYYEAPFQVKANGGMLLIDDFGRQQARPRDLLNRWIVPLEKRVDFLTLHTGRKLEVPFDVLIVFSTNLAPRDLVDEAFLRRIRHKIEIQDPSWDEYREIFRRVCASRKVAYDDRGLAYLIQEHYLKHNRPRRACHPRDLVDQLIDTARYMGVQPVLSKDLIDRACEAYFVEI